MKSVWVLFAMILMLVTSCGDDKTYYNNIEKEVVVAQEFEGVFFLNNNSMLELVASEDNEVSILRTGYTLTSINPKNQTLGMHPVVTQENLEIHNGKLFFSLNVNYGSDGSLYDLEEDENGNNITGTRRTDYTFSMLEDGNIKLHIQIYANSISHNINWVVASRWFKSR